MTPFDANYIADEELDLKKLAESRSIWAPERPVRTVRPAHRPTNTRPGIRNAWRRTDLMERFLESLDVDSVITSLVFIALYIGLMNAL